MTRSGILFDVDGTLVDTTYLHAVCWARAFARTGRYPSMALVHRAVGMGGQRLVNHILGDGVGKDDAAAIIDAHSVLYAEWHSRLHAFDKSADLLRACHQRGLTVALASSAGAGDMSVLRATLDAEDAVDVVTTSDDADASKPEPDILQAALGKAQLSAENVVFVGDAVWDVQACQRAGIPCVGLECGGTSRAELLAAGAVEVWKDPADLLTHFQESALGRLIGR
ncbi:MAG: HAD family hydrolase [Micrococcales bacterium]|nr:HAD family hydrolase [Micrococcales bacterium]